MTFISDIWALVYLRLRLLLRQRLGWISIVVGSALVVISLIVAQVSFVTPQKIFWDFALAVSFILQICLALYLGSQLFPDEKNRRTLHLILSGGISRLTWIVGNGLGIFLALLLMNIFWFLLMVGAAYLNFDSKDIHLIMPLQAQLMLSVEVLILIFFSLFLSLCVRPLLALLGAFIGVFLLHSLTDLQRIFTDPQVGRFIEDRGINIVLWIGKFLPPLEWFDLKVFVGYQDQVEWLLIGKMSFLGIVWSVFFATVAWLKFDGMDL